MNFKFIFVFLLLMFNISYAQVNVNSEQRLFDNDTEFQNPIFVFSLYNIKTNNLVYEIVTEDLNKLTPKYNFSYKNEKTKEKIDSSYHFQIYGTTLYLQRENIEFQSKGLALNQNINSLGKIYTFEYDKRISLDDTLYLIIHEQKVVKNSNKGRYFSASVYSSNNNQHVFDQYLDKKNIQNIRIATFQTYLNYSYCSFKNYKLPEIFTKSYDQGFSYDISFNESKMIISKSTYSKSGTMDSETQKCKFESTENIENTYLNKEDIFIGKRIDLDEKYYVIFNLIP